MEIDLLHRGKTTSTDLIASNAFPAYTKKPRSFSATGLFL